MIDIVDTRQQIVQYLGSMGFRARDADVSDLQHGGDKDLRFKIGTAYKEVTIMVIHKGVNTTTMRILDHSHMPRVQQRLMMVIRAHWEKKELLSQ